ncbi:MAG: VOC family protein [Myxococcales bacterium]|nr:VOC family protein [Myxococcales bacterium]MCB9703741.1 VOC family protein [Myxococcales bacterium]
MQSERPAFHLAFAVDDLEAARAFYAGVLGCPIGREDTHWIDFDFFGHQISAHKVSRRPKAVPTSAVDGKAVPVRHFGAILEWGAWHELADRLRAAGIEFLIEPHIRFVGEPGEQATMFFLDPSGNALEFKSFRDMAKVFAR